jgi:hypothetical protein
MAKRSMTNIEKVQHIMGYSRYGALAQLFVMDALYKWTGIISKAPPEQVDNGFVDGEAWIGVAKEIQNTLKADLTIDDPDLEDDEAPFGEIHFESEPVRGRRPDGDDSGER